MGTESGSGAHSLGFHKSTLPCIPVPFTHVSASVTVVSTRDDFCPLEDKFQCLETFSVVTTQGLLLASSGERPWMLLNTLQCTGQPPANTYAAHNVHSAELEKPCSIVRTSDVELANGLMNDRGSRG